MGFGYNDIPHGVEALLFNLCDGVYYKETASYFHASSMFAILKPKLSLSIEVL